MKIFRELNGLLWCTYLSLYEDPEDWTPIVRVTCDTPVYLRAGGLIFRDEQPHDIMPLLPRDISAVAPLTHLLGKEMIDGEASHWTGTDFSLPLRYHGHQLDWTTSLHGRGTFFTVQVYIAVFFY
jgi:hypothetical protein